MRCVLIVALSIAGTAALACDACKFNASDLRSGGGVGLTAGIGDSEFKWSLDTTFDYRNMDRVNPSVALEINERENGHIHSIQDEWTVAARIGYNVTRNLNIGLSHNYRHLNESNTTDPLLLGRHSIAQGFGDLEFDLKYRFKEQEDDGFPVDLAIFGSVKAPTGDTTERARDGFLFSAHDQPGSGSWDGSLGMAVSKRWGDWGASGSLSYSLKGEGTQHYKATDSLRFSMGASRKLPWTPCGCRIYVALGMQAVNEFKAKDHGEIDRNHGGQHIYVIPGISVQPIDRLSIGTSLIMPAYQEFNGTHQRQDFGVVFSIGVRF